MEECFVQVPVDRECREWASGCFADEFTQAWEWLWERDHIFPRSRFPELEFEPWNWHSAHAGCQRKQAGMIGGLARVPKGPTPEEQSVINRAVWARRTPAERKAYQVKIREATPIATRLRRSQLSLHNRWHRNRGIVSPYCSVCVENPVERPPVVKIFTNVNHVRWHVKRNLIKEECELCQTKQSASASTM
jgi:hypothetical protein